MTLPTKAADAPPPPPEKTPATSFLPPDQVVVPVDGTTVAQATGAGDSALGLHWLTQVATVAPSVVGDPAGPLARANRVLASLTGIAPKDTVEGMLAVQMTALHELAMATMQRAAAAENPENRDRAVRQATRLQGAFLATVDGLKRWRGGTTTQRVVVERVEVQAGGQAVVGAVASGGREGGWP